MSSGVASGVFRQSVLVVAQASCFVALREAPDALPEPIQAAMAVKQTHRPASVVGSGQRHSAPVVGVEHVGDLLG